MDCFKYLGWVLQKNNSYEEDIVKNTKNVDKWSGLRREAYEVYFVKKECRLSWMFNFVNQWWGKPCYMDRSVTQSRRSSQEEVVKKVIAVKGKSERGRLKKRSLCRIGNYTSRCTGFVLMRCEILCGSLLLRWLIPNSWEWRWSVKKVGRRKRRHVNEIKQTCDWFASSSQFDSIIYGMRKEWELKTLKTNYMTNR